MALPGAAVADALVRLGPEVRRAFPGGPISGPAVPVRHFGSVDVFFEAYETASPGGVLVIDNEGRDDEACIGDLTVAEARLTGLAGIVLWGFPDRRASAARGGALAGRDDARLGSPGGADRSRRPGTAPSRP